MADELALSPGSQSAMDEFRRLADERLRARLAADPSYDDLRNLTAEQFISGRKRRFGTTNPEIQDVPFYNAMIEAGVNPYLALKIIPGAEELVRAELRASVDGQRAEPTWTAGERLGSTETELPDGRIVDIGGEHEDFYDPDFCIYNDVMVTDNDGVTTLYGYPRSVFPPTDQHTATLVGPYIYIVGGAGYTCLPGRDDEPGRDAATTPVYRLDTRDFHIDKVAATGEQPAALFEHDARLLPDGTIEITGGRVEITSLMGLPGLVDNEHTYILDPQSCVWQRAASSPPTSE